jgi:predicted nucleic acid-binding protein
MWVFDATPLIYLAKVDRLGIVRHLDGPAVIPERVREEVVEVGLDQGYPDARRVERGIEAGLLDTVTVADTALVGRLRENPNLSDADAAVLAHAGVHDGVAVMDDAYGRDVAATEGIITRGTAYLVLLATREGEIGTSEARDTIDGMIEEGWYCAPDVYARILRKLESVADPGNR